MSAVKIKIKIRGMGIMGWSGSCGMGSLGPGLMRGAETVL